MRSPDHGKPAHPRAGKTYEADLSLRYLSPGAFTVLPPDAEPPPDPPAAPPTYKLTPTSKRHRNQSFAIIAEPGSRGGSRTGSPTNGRSVSPFRGRGFNPTGSRHVSPAPSPPPPEDARLSPRHASPKNTKIPRARGVSPNVFGERIVHGGDRKKLQSQFSKSLTNVSATRKPPPSPRRAPYSKPPAFQQLSPIVGSSPEPSQSQSSPSRSKIPKSRSSPSSRFTSPTRNALGSKPPSKPSSRVVSRVQSRDPSPSKVNNKPLKSYKNVHAKVNSFNRTKPKVPPKPQELSESSDYSTEPSSVNKPKLINVNNKPRITPRNSVRNKNTKNDPILINNNDNTTKNNKESKSSTDIFTKSNNTSVNRKHFDSKTKTIKKEEKDNSNINNKNNSNNKNNNNNKSNINKEINTINNHNNKTNNTKDTTESSNDENNSVNEIKKSESVVKLSDILQPSAIAVVPSTAATATQPLKINAKMEPKETIGEAKSEPQSESKTGNKTYNKTEQKLENGSNKDETKTDNSGVRTENNQRTNGHKNVSPIVDGRVLSATSVSNAMNKMNDTVLDSQTLMKDRGFTKISPAAHAIISMTNETKTTPMDSSTTPAEAPSNEPKEQSAPEEKKFNNNNLTSRGILDERLLEREVQRNMSKLISPDHVVGNSLQKALKEGHTHIPDEVKPIRIMVKEKPQEVDLESGNMRLPVSATNGLSDRPSIQQIQQNQQQNQQNATNNADSAGNDTPAKPNFCSRIFKTCKDKTICKCCKRKEKVSDDKPAEEEEATKAGCFSCRRKQDQSVKIDIDQPQEDKKKFWNRLKCCKRSKVSDGRWLPFWKKKENWAEKTEHIQSPPKIKKPCCTKDSCKDFFIKMFCLKKCFKKKFEQQKTAASRRASMISSKKKSLTPMSLPPEEVKPKLDISLVEHTSAMRGAIPVLPVCLAWFCLVLNVIVPGLGTIMSGLFCLCLGKPRFSQKDGARPRIGSFLINIIIGIGQCFTVLFCLVGWGWSIWWGVIMLKIAKKHRKLKLLEAQAENQEESLRPSLQNRNHNGRDLERGS